MRYIYIIQYVKHPIYAFFLWVWGVSLQWVKRCHILWHENPFDLELGLCELIPFT